VATEFRKGLLKSGFTMFQFSIYVRFCFSKENAVVHASRVKKALPELGKIGILTITDKQFKMMELFYGKKSQDPPYKSYQISLF
jgi:CRISPR-associated protein Cas2